MAVLVFVGDVKIKSYVMTKFVHFSRMIEGLTKIKVIRGVSRRERSLFITN